MGGTHQLRKAQETLLQTFPNSNDKKTKEKMKRRTMKVINNSTKKASFRGRPRSNTFDWRPERPRVGLEPLINEIEVGETDFVFNISATQ